MVAQPERKLKIARISIPLIMTLYVFPALAYAESGGAHGEHGPATFVEFLSSIGVYWINFLVFVGLLFLGLRKPFLKYWAQRRESISKQVSEAQALLSESKKKLLDAEVRMSAVADERRQLRAEIEKEANDQAQRVIVAAKARADLTMKAARMQAEAEREAAERAVQNEIVELALGISKEKLSSEVTSQMDSQFREKVVEGIKGIIQ